MPTGWNAETLNTPDKNEVSGWELGQMTSAKRESTWANLNGNNKLAMWIPPIWYSIDPKPKPKPPVVQTTSA